ncbi:SGNH hydrolase-type esterase domain-containing protein [Aspergillus spectabilis]
MHLWLGTCALALLAQQILAYPSPPLLYHNLTRELTGPSPSWQKRQDVGQTQNLRILPLGASITNGEKSSDQCGYRKILREALRGVNYEVDMIGSKRTGLEFKDNDNEGWGGYTIKQVWQKAKPQYMWKPNLVLINAGTNNCRLDEADALADGYSDMRSMVLDIFDNVEGVTIILSGLLPNREQPECNRQLNDGYRTLAHSLAREGRKIIFANLYYNWIELADGTHPNDKGYEMLAAIWFRAISQARDRGFLTEPLETQAADVCDKNPGEFDSSEQTQRGSGADDGPYEHKGVAQGKAPLAIGQVKMDDVGQTIFWASMYGKDEDYLIWYQDPDKAPGKYRLMTQWRSGEKDFIQFDVKDACKPKGVRWGDVNGDGWDDFICIGPEGNMYVSLRKPGQDQNGRVPVFEPLGLYLANPRSGSSQTHVRLGDIDGDGRLDYCLIAGNGDISCWRNGGTKDKAEYWQALGVVFTGKDKGNIDGVRLVDINGDHRADWLYVNDDGSVDTYINNRGHDKSLRPDWSDVGRTHAGMDEKGARDYIQFARIGHTGRADYVWQNPVKSGKDMEVELHWWKNEGSGGTMLKADGNNYCDLTGDGVDDYIWVSNWGDIQIFRNTLNPPNWGQHDWYFPKHWSRKLIRIADVDGDGKCDLIYIDNEGNVYDWFKTEYSGSKFKFISQGPRPQMGSCAHRSGVGLFDLAVRFADLNGDKKADKLCIDRDGRTSAFISTDGDNYIDMGQVKKPEGKDRANLRFVDVNGDRKADMIWLDKFGGTSQVWYNEKMEPAPDTNSNMVWRPGGDAYLQSARGECIHYANLRGSGRADMIDATPRTNEATTWFTTSCGGGGRGDDGPIVPPQLPDIPEEDEPPSEGETPPGGEDPPPHDDDDNNPDDPSDPEIPETPQPDVPFPPFDRFIALGDSYSAGVGSGARVRDDYDQVGDCHKNEGGYPHQLWKYHPILQQPGRNLDFISCTGAKAENLFKNGVKQFGHLRGTQIEMLDELIPKEDYGWGTLSIGGNDLGFTPIAIWCLYFSNKARCEKALNKAWRSLKNKNENGQPNPEYDPSFSLNLRRVYHEILDTATTPSFTLIVTGYAQFFNHQTDVCNNQNLLPVFGASLTKEKRKEMNELVLAVNRIIEEAVNEVNAEYQSRSVRKYIRWFNIDEHFEGNRFCEANRDDWRDHAWFFSPFFNPDPRPPPPANPPPGYDHELVRRTDGENFYWSDLYPADYSDCPPEDTELDTDLGAECYMLRALDPGEAGYNGHVRRSLDTKRQSIKQMMHPKWAGHAATMGGITKRWFEEWGRDAPRGPPRPFSAEE